MSPLPDHGPASFPDDYRRPKGQASTSGYGVFMGSGVSRVETDIKGSIQGLQVQPFDTNRDTRGSFTEIFCHSWRLPIEPVQWSLVTSKARVLRGMHLHFRHDEYISVVRGRACVGLYDFRRGSPTYGRSAKIELNGESPACVSFPRGILHGWYFYEDSTHLQAVSEQYKDYGHDDNHGCLWSDAALGIEWPDPKPLLSPRAAGFPSLEQLKRDVGQPD